jgi:hypothetical protein
VVPYLELVIKPDKKATQLNTSIDKEMRNFEDLLTVVGEVPPFFNTKNEEVNRFRRAAAQYVKFSIPSFNRLNN